MDKVIETKSQMIMRIAELSEANERLQAENERLKEEKQELNIEIVSLTSKLFTLEKSSNDLSQCANKLHKALQEIRDMAENHDVVPCLEHNCDCANCDDETTDNGKRCMQYGLEKILDKINSVIGAE